MERSECGPWNSRTIVKAGWTGLAATAREAIAAIESARITWRMSIAREATGLRLHIIRRSETDVVLPKSGDA
jgi:hypothetical protein